MSYELLITNMGQDLRIASHGKKYNLWSPIAKKPKQVSDTIWKHRRFKNTVIV